MHCVLGVSFKCFFSRENSTISLDCKHKAGKWFCSKTRIWGNPQWSAPWSLGVLKHKNKDILYPPHRLLIEHILRCEWKYVIKPQNEGVGKDALEVMSSSCEDASTRCCRVLAARCLQFSPTTCQASCSYFYCCFWHIAHAYCSPPFSLISVILGCLELFLTHISVPIKEYGQCSVEILASLCHTLFYSSLQFSVHSHLVIMVP